MTKRPAGYVLFEGPSAIDGAPVVVIAIVKSTNVKTGNMIQTYILRADMSPLEAAGQGLDYSICGDCPHRGIPGSIVRALRARIKAELAALRGRIKAAPKTDRPGLRAELAALRADRMAELSALVGRSCYVNLGQGPLAVWKAYKAGNYPKMSPANRNWFAIVSGRMVRAGTYGDPAAVPHAFYFWRKVFDGAQGWTGYTHQWQRPENSQLAGLFMASADSPAKMEEAQAMGWRTFRVRMESQPLSQNETTCPASIEAGKRALCADCKLCQGTTKTARSIAIIAHGGTAVAANAAKRLPILAMA